MADLVVIGAGPAALAAAFYAAGKRLNTVIVYEQLGGKIGWLDALVRPGGGHPLPGNELVSMLARTVIESPDRAVNDHVVRVERQRSDFSVITAGHGAIEASAIVVATGAAPRPLDVPGAARFGERGPGYSISTFAHQTVGQRVAVIGSTTRAISGAAELATTAAHVTLIAPWPLSPDTALSSLLRLQANVDVLERARVVELLGDERLEALLVEQDGRLQRLAIDRAFVALGLKPNSEAVRDLVETDGDGFIRVNAFHETSAEGIFAAGDVCSIFAEQVLAAIGDGARAAMHAYDYLLGRRLAA